jgi:hypothetical protein
MARIAEKAKKENVYLSNGVTAYRLEPTGEKEGRGFIAYIKMGDGEALIDLGSDRLNKMIIEEEGEEIDRENYYSHINSQVIF